MLLCTAFALACPSSQREQGPRGGGEISVWLQSPSNSDRAIVFDLTGLAQGVSAAPQTTLRALVDTITPESVRVAVIAPRGTSITAGEVARFLVQDVCALSRYRIAIVDVAGNDYSLKTLSGYALSIRSPEGTC